MPRDEPGWPDADRVPAGTAARRVGRVTEPCRAVKEDARDLDVGVTGVRVDRHPLTAAGRHFGKSKRAMISLHVEPA